MYIFAWWRKDLTQNVVFINWKPLNPWDKSMTNNTVTSIPLLHYFTQSVNIPFPLHSLQTNPWKPPTMCSFWCYFSSSQTNHDSRLLPRVETNAHSMSEASSKRSLWPKVLVLLGRAGSKKQHTEHASKKDKAKKYYTKTLPERTTFHQEYTFIASSNSFLHNNCWNQALFAFTNFLWH